MNTRRNPLRPVAFTDLRRGDILRLPGGDRQIATVAHDSELVYYFLPDNTLASIDAAAVADIGGSLLRGVPAAWTPIEPGRLAPGDRALLQLDNGAAIDAHVTANSPDARAVTLDLDAPAGFAYTAGSWFTTDTDADG